MPGGRRLPRTVRSTLPTPVVPLIPGDITSSRYAPLGATVPTLPGLEQPSAPKHFPFPNTSVDDDLVFELLMFFFTTVATGLQYLHLYRSVWWLPNSHTNHAMNFYLIDQIIVVFILTILSRRVLYILSWKLLEKIIPIIYQEVIYFMYMMMFSSLIIGFLFGIGSTMPYGYVNIFFLWYPAFVYLILFGFKISPLLEPVTLNTGSPMPLHACTSSAVEVRQEVENLKTNFNIRMKQVLFNSVLNAYYAGFIPWCLAPITLYYDVYWVTQHVIFIFLSCFAAYAVHMFNLRYCDTLHRSALHLGCWDRVETRSILPVAYTWQEDMLWPCGALVRHGRDMYRAQGESNAAEPGITMYSRFYSIFKNPSVALSGLLALQIFLVLFQLALLVGCTFWYHIISLTFLLFFNYYILFKLGRDYLVSLKIYKAERAMRDKINMH